MNSHEAPSIESLMKRGYLFLEDSDWTHASEYFDKVLDIEPEFAQAYIGKLCVDLSIGNEMNLLYCNKVLDDMPNMKKALRFADTEYRARLVGYLEGIRQRQERIAEEHRLETEKKIADLVLRLQEHEANHDIKLKEYNSELKKWQEITDSIQAQSNEWKLQKLCPHCGGKVGLFGSCKVCRKNVSASIQLPSAPIPVSDRSPFPRMNIEMGGYNWKVLDNQKEKVLLLSNSVLSLNQYNNCKQNIEWENCTLRHYLNDEFFSTLDIVFKSLIEESHITNDNNQWCKTCGGMVTDDKVFLLSLEEVVYYFGDSGDLRNRPTIRRYDKEVGYWDCGVGYIDDKFNSARIAKNEEGVSYFWWLRSPGCDRNSASYVDKDGKISVVGSYVNLPFGVRPALWLRIDNYSNTNFENDRPHLS